MYSLDMKLHGVAETALEMNTQYGYDPWQFSHKYFHIRQDFFNKQSSGRPLIQILELKISDSNAFAQDYEKVVLG